MWGDRHYVWSHHNSQPCNCQGWHGEHGPACMWVCLPGSGTPQNAHCPKFLLLRGGQTWLIQTKPQAMEATWPCQLVAMGMKTQMLTNHQTIVSTSNPPRCVRALLTMVGEDAGLGQCVGSSCRAQARAWLTLTPNYSKGREKQPQSPLSGSHLRRRWHFSKKPHCVMMTRLNTRRGYGSATKTPALSPLPASQRDLGF